MLSEKELVIEMTGTPIKFSRSPGSVALFATKYGEHIVARYCFSEAGVSRGCPIARQALEQRGRVSETTFT